MRQFEGSVVLVQESRFLVQSSTGDHKFFVLSHRAAAEPAQLAPLAARQARVRVSYSAAPDQIADVAHAVVLCP
ncbi:MAG: hypothetical protein JOY70_05720 [Acidisphaera sp.]|nr:hypothetical protein [Acidisphaera sp.]MBV9811376.1 hypothetical protein [Acetobacteraceae bacterium]